MNQLYNSKHSKTVFVIFLIHVISSLYRLDFVPLCPLSESYFAFFKIVDEAISSKSESVSLSHSVMAIGHCLFYAHRI
jgi:hypothetical protein